MITKNVQSKFDFEYYDENLEISTDPWIFRNKGLFWDIGGLKVKDEGITVLGANGIFSSYFTIILKWLIYPNLDQSVNFNIWEEVVWNGEEGYAQLIFSDMSCAILTDDKNNPKVLPKNKDSMNLTYSYTGDSAWIFDQTKKYEFELVVLCKDTVKEPVWKTQAQNPCKIAVEWESPAGCPILKLNALWNYFNKYKMYLTPAVIIIGLIFWLFGSFFTKISVFLISWVTVIFICLVIVYGLILSFSTPEWVGWMILPTAAIIGLFVASFLVTFLKIGVFLVGAWFGGTFASMLFEMFVYKLSSKGAVLWGMIIITGLVVGIISLKFLKAVMVVGTSFIGAFMIMRGLSFYLGGYPNEFELYNEIQVGDYDNVPASFYVYALGIFILFVLGIVLQHKKTLVCSMCSGKRGKSFKYEELDD